MKAGRLDRRISILRAVAGENALGEDAPASWPVLATVWAEVRPLQGGERLASGETAAEGQTLFRMRWSTTIADVGAKERVSYGGRTYDIASAIELGRREGIEILGNTRRE